MSVKDVRTNALSKYKAHKFNSWIISIICGLFLGAITLLGLISEALIIVLIPFLVLPFLFSCVLSHTALSEKDELTARNMFGFYRLFFRPPFFNSFSAIRSFFKSLLAELALGFVATWIIFAVFSARSETFIISLNQVIESISDMSITQEVYQAALEANGGELGNFMDLTNAVNFLIFAFAFILFILKEEITIYIRVVTKNVPLAHQIARNSIRENTKKYYKSFFGLNWPLFVIILVGMIGGCFLSILVFHNYSICGAVGLAMGIALSSAFLPFYFSNMEAIFEDLSIDISGATTNYIERVFGVTPEKPINSEESVDGRKKDSDDSESK